MTSHSRRAFLQGSLSALALGALAACSNDSDSGSAADSQDFSGTGPINYAQGKDFSSGMVQKRLDEWNRKYPDEKVTLIELSSEADQQRSSLVNSAQTKSDAYDVISLDLVWVAEFAANRWVMQLPADKLKNSDIIPSVWETGLYRDNMYGMPYVTDASLLYYRKDLLDQAGVKKVPTTWDELLSAIEAVRRLPGHADIGGIGGQWNKYEGLTCNISEFIHTMGGAIVDDQSKVVLGDSTYHDKNVKAIQFVIDAFKSNVIPKEALEWKEEDGRGAFESGKLLFYRQWPYQYSNNVKNLGTDKFDVSPMPSIDGNKYVATLGGHNCAISTNCRNKATALKFITWWTSKETQQYNVDELSNAPILGSLYSDKTNVKELPYLPPLKASLDKAKGRPRVVNYGDVTAAVQDAIYPAIKDGGNAEDVVATLNDSLKSIIKN